jgi:hypothetical protein
LKVPLVNYVELLIPCILHLENRVGEKLLTMILRIGMDIWRSTRKNYVEDIETFFWTQVLGTAVSPAHWSLPHDGKSEADLCISKIPGRNEMIHHMVAKSDNIINACLPGNQEISGKLQHAVNCYRGAMRLLNKHCNLTEDKVENFQNLADEFFKIWVEMFGPEGVANYIHLIGSSHMLYFLQQIGCLYLCNQQGWE